MTEKILKHELYKHGSYLISLKESGSSFVNIDDEIKKLEELFQLASKKDQPAAFTSEEAMWEYKYNELKALYEQMCQANEDLIQKNNKLKVDHQPTFEVGEYYQTTRKGRPYIFRVSKEFGKNLPVKCLAMDSGWFSSDLWIIAKMEPCEPATAEQIAEFKRAEHFASKGRKLDEFHVGDKVFHSDGSIGKVVEIKGEELIVVFRYQKYSFREFQYRDFELIQTAEELREVEDNAD